jgi:hypothetical protein
MQIGVHPADGALATLGPELGIVVWVGGHISPA